MGVLQPAPDVRTGHAMWTALGAWAGFCAFVLAAGLATGVWRLGGRALSASVLFTEYGLLTLAGTLVLVGGPTFVYRRFGLVVPLVGLALFFAYFAVLGLSAGMGAAGLYVAFLYAGLAIPVLAALGGVEYLLRAAGPTLAT